MRGHPWRVQKVLAFALLTAPLFGEHRIGAQSTPTASAPIPAAYQKLAAALDSIARAAVAKGPIPGMSIAVVKGNTPLLMKGYGYADLENDVPATVGTVYRIGSITKQFTAAAIMRLVEQQKLSLEDPLTKFFPDYPVRGNTVTVHELLNHTSGIHSYTSMGPRWQRRMRDDMEPDSMIAFFRDEPFDFAPGTQWRYDNSGYFLLGRIIEKTSGRTYAEYVRDELFQPLGLTGTHYCDLSPIIKRRAQGYGRAKDAWTNAAPLSMTQPYAAGSLCSTVGDLVAWTRALHAGRVVKPSSLTRMTTPDKLVDGKPLDYGFGLLTGSLNGHRLIGHGGGINGFATYLGYYPQDTLTVVVLTNTESGNPDAVARSLSRRALGIPEPKPKDLALSAEELIRYAGTYSVPSGPTFRIVEEHGSLILELPGESPDRLLYQGSGEFVSSIAADFGLAFEPISGARAKHVKVADAGHVIFEAERTQ
jgi:D-alanyl-D-alanine carboxypeptidase